MIQARTHTDNDNNKVKQKLEFKMPSFVQYLDTQIVLTERKTGLITVYRQLLKTMVKKT